MPKLELSKIAISLTKDGASPPNQVPASGAVAQIYRQGATVMTTTTISNTDTVPIPVYNTGGLLPGDSLHIDTGGATTLTVSAVDSETNIVSVINNGSTINVTAGQRLVAASPQPTLFSEASGQSAIAGSSVTLDSRGKATIYTTPPLVDYVVTGGGTADGLYVDQQAGWTPTQVPWVNARDCASIEDAVAACPTGGTVYIPAGTYMLKSPAGVSINRAMTIQGEASRPDQLNSGTIIRPFDAGPNTAQNSDVFVISAHNVEIRDLDIIPLHPATQAGGSGCGIRMENGSGLVISSVRLTRLAIYGMGSDGVRLHGNSGSIDFAVIRDVFSNNNWGHGFSFKNAPAIFVEGCYASANWQCGVRAESCGAIHLHAVACQGNGMGSMTSTDHPQMFLTFCHAGSLVGCYYEDFSQYSNKTALIIDQSIGGSVTGCNFNNNVQNIQGTRAVYLTLNTRGWTIGSSLIDSVDVAVEVQGNAGVYGNTIMPQGVRVASQYNRGRIVVPADAYSNFNLYFGRTIESSAFGEGDHLAGIVMPRVTIADFTPPLPNPNQDPSGKVNGLLIYDDGNKALRYYDGQAWQVARGPSVQTSAANFSLSSTTSTSNATTVSPPSAIATATQDLVGLFFDGLSLGTHVGAVTLERTVSGSNYVATVRVGKAAGSGTGTVTGKVVFVSVLKPQQ